MKNPNPHTLAGQVYRTAMQAAYNAAKEERERLTGLYKDDMSDSERAEMRAVVSDLAKKLWPAG